jgi:SsrA-binding protein
MQYSVSNCLINFPRLNLTKYPFILVKYVIVYETAMRGSEIQVPKQKGVKEITANRKAFHEYFVLERFEAGIELAGTEVKSIRAGNVNLKDSFCTIKNGELFVRGMHISPYEQGNIFNRDPVRPRRLLMHKREIVKLNARVMQDGVALIPLSMYFKDSRVKLELGLCKGKKLHDKRDSEADRQSKRDIDRIMKERNYQ